MVMGSRKKTAQKWSLLMYASHSLILPFMLAALTIYTLHGLHTHRHYSQQLALRATHHISKQHNNNTIDANY